MSGLPSYSNCTTEVLSGVDDAWKFAQPELVRRSPIGDEVHLTPPRMLADKVSEEQSPQLTSEPSIKKMDSVEISCLEDNLLDSHNKSESSETQGLLVEIDGSPDARYSEMVPSITSTPFTEPDAEKDNFTAIPMALPDEQVRTPEINVPNFQTFLQSAELRPQDISSNASNECVNSLDTEILLEGESKSLSRASNWDSVATERTPTYSDFENSAFTKPQDLQSRDKSSQSMESGINSEDFHQFENSIRSRPQDLSLGLDASSMLLKSERQSSDLAASSSTDTELEQASQSGNREINSETKRPVDISPPSNTNLIESQEICYDVPVNNFLIDFDMEEETEQPHSIIITETPKEIAKDSPNRTFDSHTAIMLLDLNNTYDSHEKQTPNKNESTKTETSIQPIKVNGVSENEDLEIDNVVAPKSEYVTQSTPKSDDLSEAVEQKSPKNNTSEELIHLLQPAINNTLLDNHKNIPNGSHLDAKVLEDLNEIKCNGGAEKFATVQFLSETFEELVESNVDDDSKDLADDKCEQTTSPDNSGAKREHSEPLEISSDSVHASPSKETPEQVEKLGDVEMKSNGISEDKVASVTENFLQNEKKFCQLDSYFPLLSDIRFTGELFVFFTLT